MGHLAPFLAPALKQSLLEQADRNFEIAVEVLEVIATGPGPSVCSLIRNAIQQKRVEDRMRRPSRASPVAVAIGFAFAAVIAILILPPVIRFIVFLMSGDVWRALTGIALISFLVGLALAAVLGFLERGQSPGALDETRPRRKGWGWMLVWACLLVAPVCLVVALVASGVLMDSVHWSRDRIDEIRGAQNSS